MEERNQTSLVRTRSRSASSPLKPKKDEVDRIMGHRQSIGSADKLNEEPAELEQRPATADSRELSPEDRLKSTSRGLDGSDERKTSSSFSAKSKGPDVVVRSGAPGSRKTRPISVAGSFPNPVRIDSNSDIKGSRDFVLADGISKSFHYYGVEETAHCASYLNSILQPHLDPDLAHLFPSREPLPTTPGTACDEALFNACRDGLLIAKLIEYAVPGQTLLANLKKKPKNRAHVSENVQITLQAARNIGVRLSNIGPEDIMKGTPHLTLSLIWQTIKIALLAKVNVQNDPNLNALLSETERSNAGTISKESLLLKWLNFHLNGSGTARQAANFTKDLSDGIILGNLMMHILPADDQRREVMQELHDHFEEQTNPLLKAQAILKMAEIIGIKPFITAKDIVEGHRDHAITFIAQLFDKFPRLDEKPVTLLVSTAESTPLMSPVSPAKDDSDLRDELENLQKELASLQRAHAALKADHQKSQLELSSMASSLRERDMEIGRIRAELKLAHEQEAQAKINLTQIQSMRESLSALQEKSDASVKELAMTRFDLEELRKQHAATESDIIAASQEKNSLATEFLEYKQKMESQVSSLNLALKKEQALVHEKDSSQSKELTVVRAELAAVKKKLDIAESEKMIAARDREADVAELKALKAKSEVEITNLSAALAKEKLAATEKVGSLHEQVFQISEIAKGYLNPSEVVELEKNPVVTLRSMFRNFDLKQRELERTVEAVKDENMILKRRSANDKESIALEYSEKLAIREKQMTQLHAELEKMTDAAGTSKKAHVVLEKRVVELETSISEKDQAVQNWKKTCEILQEDLNARDNQRKSLNASAEQTVDKLNDILKAASTIRTNMDQARIREKTEEKPRDLERNLLHKLQGIDRGLGKVTA
eukprot:Partr_v1_DN28356_c1_g1_i1_m78990 putative lymphocyte cytosolic protein 1 (L-plastin)